MCAQTSLKVEKNFGIVLSVYTKDQKNLNEIKLCIGSSPTNLDQLNMVDQNHQTNLL